MTNLNCNILIVDDVEVNIQMAMNILAEENYNLTSTYSGNEALTLIQNNHYDLILLDLMMPGMDGFTVCTEIKKMPNKADVPIIFLTAKDDIDSISHAFYVGAVDYVRKPFHPEELISRVKSHIELYRSRFILKQHNLSLQLKKDQERQRLMTELEEVQKEIIYILAEFIESSSLETGHHIKRVSTISKLLAEYHPSMTQEDVSIIYHASPMHDIGKIAISDDILHKSGKLTVEEFEIMKMHTLIAHKFLKKTQRKILKAADIIATQHHEKWDGTGYPYGLKGEDIHLFGRIVALADVFDSLTHKRAYKEAWSVGDAITHIQENSGIHFDPTLVAIFIEHIDDFIFIVEES